MKNQISKFYLGDVLLQYYVDENGKAAMEMIPADMEERVCSKEYQLDSLVQVYFSGDNLPGGFINGHSMRNSASTWEFSYDKQMVSEADDIIEITTYLKDNREHEVRHIVTYRKGLLAFEVKTILENKSSEAVNVEMLSSFSFGGLTPFVEGDAHNAMRVHRFRSCWSAEGRLDTQTVEDMQLEPSWAGCGVRNERFGQVGSMPVRKYFPFQAVEDVENKVVWAAQIACGSSWQMELYRTDQALCMSGGLADYDFGHWMKTIRSGESLETPVAYLTVGCGDVNTVSQRLLTLQQYYFDQYKSYEKLPVVFNEFCTTWGEPSHENISKICRKIKGKGIDYFVIDCGWYKGTEYSWSETNGDWNISEELFPEGLDKTVSVIKNSGMKPGIWFEFETCAIHSNIREKTDMLLTRNGVPVSTGGKRFLDMRKETVQNYIREKVIALLKEYEFEYIKVDYNDSIGIGCDGSESFGEGLRESVLCTQEMFREIRSQVPGVLIENCSSGGHRLEPSFMKLCDMGSFSDAHECLEIPIIAANLHRLILPAQSQIWVVLRGEKNLRELNYMLVSSLLGVMCLSGEIYNLNQEQWEKLEEGIAFYKHVNHIIAKGISSFYGPKVESYRHPEGWQGVVRYNKETGESLVVIHSFGGAICGMVEIPVNGDHIISTMSSGNNTITLSNHKVIVELKEQFEAVAIWCN